VHHRVISFANAPGSSTNAIDSGDINTCTGADKVSFYDIKAKNFNYANYFTHKYLIFGHNVHCFGGGDPECTGGNCTNQCAANPTACSNAGTALGYCGTLGPNTTGLAELPGNDFMVTLGGHQLQDGTNDGGDPVLITQHLDELARWQAATIMH